ncbi:DUF262 and DUF1524 domain-containing protein [Methanoregula sp.]|uniref:DUF262 and DUF1524 domain-containing protein n=1 Tax=Methanoregula sp. TaxID=2052170 RepID=UPI002C06AE79|nr:DUF262 and DUF1524 domain-containing protein [Methanoregula sp.]HVP95654.1 DUF262 and DUF1524 domain-containing protein [Methanoregula sp.]
MNAKEIQLTRFLDGTKQFLIPIYQRTYRWERDQCEQLWKDIIKVGSDEKIAGHFIGSIVYIEKGQFQVASPPQLLVIDGHQRLTTISLLFIALSHRMRDQNIEGEISSKKILNYYLLNSNEEGELRYKLILTRTDKSTLIDLIDDAPLKVPASHRIIENYKFFEDQIKKSPVDILTIYKGIKKLLMVDISLDRTQDNPQRIFESMNSTGMDLTQTDLVRNYILMDREINEQAKFYNNYWYPMEQSFGQEEYAELFNRFMRDYLTIKSRDIPTFRGVYEAFKSYTMGMSPESFEPLLADITKYANYYVQISREKEPDPDLRDRFHDINELRVEVAFPFLLEVYEDYKQGLLTLDDFKTILNTVESFVFRRAICGIPTNALNLIFANIGKEIDKKNYVESFQANLLLKDKYKRFPNNEEFKSQFMIKDLYHYPRRNYWLRKLENFQHKERINVEEYTIEHIMPQDEKLSPEWKLELGENWKEIHKTLLHTLGNLTLTGYNSEYGKRPFREKRDMDKGFKDSHLRLNDDLAKLDHWNESEINNRAQRLAELATQVWPYPQLAPEIVQKYQKAEKSPDLKIYTLAIHPHVYEGGKNEELFQLLRKRILNLDASVTEEILKIYIAYKTDTNFVDVVPLKSRLNLTLNVKFGEIQDPKGLCTDVTGNNKWGNGDVEIRLTSANQLDDVMALVKQSFEKHSGMNRDYS